jgi:hypothetical protein
MGDAKSGFAAEAYEIIEFRRVKPRFDVFTRLECWPAYSG